MNNTKDAHELQEKIPRADQGKSGREGTTADLLAPPENLDLQQNKNILLHIFYNSA